MLSMLLEDVEDRKLKTDVQQLVCLRHYVSIKINSDESRSRLQNYHGLSGCNSSLQRRLYLGPEELTPHPSLLGDPAGRPKKEQVPTLAGPGPQGPQHRDSVRRGRLTAWPPVFVLPLPSYASSGKLRPFRTPAFGTGGRGPGPSFPPETPHFCTGVR